VTSKLTHLSCFSGIGGIDRGGELAGFETIGQIELADYPYQILCKHWPTVEKWRNICEVDGKQIIKKIGIPTLISGGFPCQDVSIAGKQKGVVNGKRSSLFGELIRIVDEIKPKWVLIENVSQLCKNGLPIVLCNLTRIGYDAEWYTIRASSAGANHRRKRTFIISYPRGSGLQRGEQGLFPALAQGYGSSYLSTSTLSRSWERDGVPTPRICRAVDGIPNRVHRIECLGNAVVPQQVYPIFKAIADIEIEKDLNSNND
jgi:DNA (cytosine-5)-methyltransferase 1